MKKIKKLMICSMLLVFSAVLFAGCDDKKAPDVDISLDENVYYLTTQTLSDVVVDLEGRDIEGKLEWEDSTLAIQLGPHSYDWKYTPDDKDLKQKTGSIIITGYQLVDLSNITLTPLLVQFNGENISDAITISELLPNDVSYTITEECINAGEYDVTVNITPKANRVIKATTNGVLTRDTVQKPLHITISGSAVGAIGAIESKDFNNEVQAPVVSIAGLVKDTDYTLSWEYKAPGETEFVEYTVDTNSFKNAGTYKVTATGKGNYTGTQTKEYVINQIDAEYTGNDEFEDVVVGDTCEDLNVTTLNANLAWDAEDEDYDTAFVAGENTRHAIYTPTDSNYKAITVDITITATEANVGTYADFNAMLTNTSIKKINIVEDITCPNPISINKEVNVVDSTINVAGKISITTTGKFTIDSDSVLNYAGSIAVAVNGGVLTNNGSINAEVSEKLELLSAINNGANRIRLIGDITSTYVRAEGGDIWIKNKDHKISIDLNNHSINATLKIKDSEVEISDLSEEKNGLIGLNNAYSYYGIAVIGGENTLVTISNISVIGYYGGFATNGTDEGATIRAINCSFTATNVADESGYIDSVGAFTSGNHNYTFTNCSFTGGSGMHAKSGTYAIQNCSFSGTSANRDITYVGNGYYSTGDGLTIESAVGYKTTLNMTIVDSTFESTNAYKIRRGVATTNPIEDYANITIDVATRDALVDAAQFADKIILAADIEGLGEGAYIGDIDIYASEKDLDFTLDLNGFAIKAELNLRNHIEDDVKISTGCSIDVVICDTSKTGTGSIGLDHEDCYFGIVLFGDDKAKLVMNNIDVLGCYAGLYTNGSISGSTIEATDCIFTGKNQTGEPSVTGHKDSAGAYLAGKYIYKFTDCTFTGGSGIHIKSGNLTLTNCSLSGDSAYVDITHNGNGAVVTGAALTAEASTEYQSPLTINIVGGTYTSENSYTIFEGTADGTDYVTITIDSTADIGTELDNTVTPEENGYYSENDKITVTPAVIED